MQQVVFAVLDRHAPASPAGDLLGVLTSVAMAMAMADAGIQASHYKYSPAHMLWRPASLGTSAASAWAGKSAINWPT